jgi:hypothetical protein
MVFPEESLAVRVMEYALPATDEVGAATVKWSSVVGAAGVVALALAAVLELPAASNATTWYV